MERKVFVVDIDNTICTTIEADYEGAIPRMDLIKAVNALAEVGHKIVYFTARGTTTGIDWRELTERQLADWGVNYHELIMGKPYGDYYIDDKAWHPERIADLLAEHGLETNSAPRWEAHSS
jgi:hypothetical protein